MATPMPKFFCVENSGYYKVYMNSIYKSSATLDREISVVWPQENIDARTMKIKLRNDQDKTTTYRKWNGKDYMMMSWSFTGSSIDMSLNYRHITITCPVIQVSDRSILPFNTCSIKPSRETFHEEEDRSNNRKGLPQHVANIVLADAISKNEICPISSEPITKDTGTVTSCGHVFCKDSIDQWLSIKNECPVCKQTCL